MSYDWISARNAGRPAIRPKVEPKVDETVSQIVHKKVYVNDPRLISLIVKWKNRKSNLEEMDDFFKNPHFLKELEETFK